MRLLSPPSTLTTQARYRWLVLGVVCLGTFMGALDLSAVNATFPVLAAAFDTSVAVIGWVTLAHMITSTTCMTIAGRLADLVGRKRVYVAGLLVVLAGSLIAGTAQSLGWLIAARVLTGLGASMAVANSVALIGATFPADRRGTAIAMMETTVALALATGPIVGGLLADGLGWRAVFFMNWPPGLVAVALAILVLREPERPGPREGFDVLGAATFAGGMVGLLLGLTNGVSLGWGSPIVLAALGLGLALLVLFIRIERRVRHPMIALALFRHPVFAAANGAKVGCYLSLMAAMFLAPFYFQRALGLGPAQIGLAMLPFPIGLSLSSLIMGPLSDRVGWRAIAPAGMAVGAVGCLLLTRIGPEGGPAAAFAAFLVLILGLGSFISPNDSAIVGAAPRDKLGVAGGILAMTRSLGMILGIALAGTILAARQPTYLAQGVDAPAAFVAAFHDVFRLTAGACILAALASLVGGKRDDRPA